MASRTATAAGAPEDGSALLLPELLEDLAGRKQLHSRNVTTDKILQEI